jgi:hypothetical protein
MLDSLLAVVGPVCQILFIDDGIASPGPLKRLVMHRVYTVGPAGISRASAQICQVVGDFALASSEMAFGSDITWIVMMDARWDDRIIKNDSMILTCLVAN